MWCFVGVLRFVGFLEVSGVLIVVELFLLEIFVLLFWNFVFYKFLFVWVVGKVRGGDLCLIVFVVVMIGFVFSLLFVMLFSFEWFWFDDFDKFLIFGSWMLLFVLFVNDDIGILCFKSEKKF